MWKNLKFSLKTAVLVAVLIAFSVLTGYGYHTLAGEIRDMGIDHSTEKMQQGYRNELKDIVDVMALSLSSAVKGVKDETRIHDIFTTLVKDVRFFPDKSGYFFIYKVGGIVFVHAAKPGLEGKNLINFKDSDGKPLIRELNQVSLSGGGYVDYWWDKPGKGLLPKLSYSRMIPNTSFWIGTGVYIDAIQEQKEAISGTIHQYSKRFLRNLYILLVVAFVMVIAPLTLLLIKSIVGPLSRLTDVADQFSRGQLDMDFSDLDREDEIGKLAKALERLGTSTKLAMQKMAKMRSHGQEG